MGIYIYGMQMPKEGVIVLKIDKNGTVCTTARNDYKKYNAIEVPSHGRLGDLDELMQIYEQLIEQNLVSPLSGTWVKLTLENVHTIISADLEEVLTDD